MSTRTETSRSIIDRRQDPDSKDLLGSVVDHLTGTPGLHRTSYYDKESGKTGRGYGNTQAEADQMARDDLADKKG